jgi:tRNA U34 5-methylaminomethyl-2-thiouridine-forming methyltransferase MnmC
MKPVKTKDNSLTFYNKEAGDYYHSQSGAKQEAVEKHAKALEVDKAENPVIFDICFGLGYNAAAALDLIENAVIYCFENDKEILKKILEIDADFRHYNLIKTFVKHFLEEGRDEYEKDDIKLIMVFGDAREKIKEIDDKADFVFFDPFSPNKVLDMWTNEFFIDIRNKMKENGRLSTYSCARFVRDNLRQAGFIVKDGPIVGRKSPSTIAIKKLKEVFL